MKAAPFDFSDLSKTLFYNEGHTTALLVKKTEHAAHCQGHAVCQGRGRAGLVSRQWRESGLLPGAVGSELIRQAAAKIF